MIGFANCNFFLYVKSFLYEIYITLTSYQITTYYFFISKVKKQNKKTNHIYQEM